MSDTKSTGRGTPAPNPAKGVQTPQLPVKSTRDDGQKFIVNTPGGRRK